ncbi:MOSC domain-containing protein [Curtobacterium sp. Leaf261]|uniref:MOSC domain-containing protein n=1 Tax=Curtobacterium sp. Leaf261 TaxID=1736311 RepID=UPI0006F70B61|nr:MOSC domain-containing protein [Curtobacterium sp. Leaf261]KQO63691.1 molybdenum cofactor biosysynthesis protein [Curtobacterium sp. Leaf261]
MTDGDPTDPATGLPAVHRVRIELLLVSSRHRYEGRPADGALPADEDERRDTIRLREGLGIVGDRYCNAPAHRRASVTVIGADALDAVAEELGVPIDPVATRRNVVLRGVDVDALRGVRFSLDSGSGPVLFQGNRPANPCAWMDHELAPGAFRAMRGRGGVRCEPLSDGSLSLGAAVLRTAVALL